MKNIMIFAAVVAISFAGFTASAEAQEAVTMKVCTALKGGNYEYTAAKLTEAVSDTTRIEIVNTKGSMDNIKMMNSGECDAAVIQSDSAFVYNKDIGAVEATKAADLYREFAHLLCSRKSGIEDIGDLTEKTKVIIGPAGGGSAVTWRGMVLADKEFGSNSYEKIPTIYGKNKATDLAKIISGEATCAFYVGTPGNQYLSRDANKLGEDLVLVPVVDKDFNDVTVKNADGEEESVWTPSVLSYSSYKNIMPSGTFGRKDVDTMSVVAQFFISNKFSNEHEDEAGEIVIALPDVKKILLADKGLSLEN